MLAITEHARSSTRVNVQNLGLTAGRGVGMPVTPPENPRIILADDHAMLRDGLISILTENGLDVVGQAAEPATAACSNVRLRGFSRNA